MIFFSVWVVANRNPVTRLFSRFCDEFPFEMEDTEGIDFDTLSTRAHALSLEVSPH